VIDLKERVAVVTGGSGGLGREYARLLAQRGARVAINDIGNGADSVAREINELGGKARAAACSVTDAGAVEEVVQQTLREWGRIDILINNAGILRDKSFAKMSIDNFRLVIEVHLMGAFNCTKAVWEAPCEIEDCIVGPAMPQGLQHTVYVPPP